MKKICNEEEETMLEMHAIQGEDIIDGEFIDFGMPADNHFLLGAHYEGTR